MKQYGRIRHQDGILKKVTVPGGSHWTCSRCDRCLEPGTEIYKQDSRRFCNPCVQSSINRRVKCLNHLP